jgi:hypothetical protein
MPANLSRIRPFAAAPQVSALRLKPNFRVAAGRQFFRDEITLILIRIKHSLY